MTIIDDYAVDSVVLKTHGHICICPRTWPLGGTVKIMFFYHKHCDFIMQYIKKSNNRTYVTMARYYVMQIARIRLLPFNDYNEKTF